MKGSAFHFELVDMKEGSKGHDADGTLSSHLWWRLGLSKITDIISKSGRLL
jgi:hypothetical protein